MRRSKVVLGVGLFAIGSLFAADSWYFETESVSPSGKWVKESTVSGYTGTGYLSYTGTDVRSATNPLLFSFDVATPGVYLFELRGRRDHSGVCEGAASDACNDVFSKVNNGTYYKTMIKKGGWDRWFWESRRVETDGEVPEGTIKFNLKAGENVFYVAGRSRGIKLDALRVYREGTTPPTGEIPVSLAKVQKYCSPAAQKLPATAYSIQGKKLAVFPRISDMEAFIRHSGDNGVVVIHGSTGQSITVQTLRKTR